MGKRVNKTTKLVVDITKSLQEKGLQFPNGAFVELELKVKHSKDLNTPNGSYIKQVTVDLTKKGDKPVQPAEVA